MGTTSASCNSLSCTLCIWVVFLTPFQTWPRECLEAIAEKADKEWNFYFKLKSKEAYRKEQGIKNPFSDADRKRAEHVIKKSYAHSGRGKQGSFKENKPLVQEKREKEQEKVILERGVIKLQALARSWLVRRQYMKLGTRFDSYPLKTIVPLFLFCQGFYDLILVLCLKWERWPIEKMWQKKFFRRRETMCGTWVYLWTCFLIPPKTKWTIPYGHRKTLQSLRSFHFAFPTIVTGMNHFLNVHIFLTTGHTERV